MEILLFRSDVAADHARHREIMEELCYPTVFHAAARVTRCEQSIAHLRHMLRLELQYEAELVTAPVLCSRLSLRHKSMIETADRIIQERNEERATPVAKRYAVRRICRQLRNMRAELRKAEDCLARMQKAA